MTHRVLSSMRRALFRVVPSPTAAPPVPSGEQVLQNRLGTAERAREFSNRQMLDQLNERMRGFISRQTMMFLATSNGRGECDNTFRAGPAGFVHVISARLLAWPEYRGNGVMASLGNIVENPHVGLLFVDFFNDGVGLHVNGRAAVVADAVIRAEHAGLPVDPAPGRRPDQWVLTEVEEAYIHCAKFIPRLRRWPGNGSAGGTGGQRP